MYPRGKYILVEGKRQFKNKHRILGSDVCHIEKCKYKQIDEVAILQVTFERRPTGGKGAAERARANEQERG